MPIPIKPFDVDDFVRRYLSGVSLKQLSQELGVSRTALGLRLKRRGIEPRGRPAAEKLKWSKMNRAATARQCGAAWRAMRGSKRSLAARIKSAGSMNGRSRSPKCYHQLELFELLEPHGFSHEFVIGPYQVDIACDPLRIAVEIQRDRSRGDGRPQSISQERLEYILGCGWNLLLVYCPPGGFWKGHKRIGIRERFDRRKVYDAVLRLVDLSRRDPSVRGQYWVIDGYAEPTSIPRLDLHGWTAIWAMNPADEPT